MDRICKKIIAYMSTDSDTSSEAYYDFGEDLDKMAEQINSDSETIRAALRYLEEEKYIRFAYSKNGAALYFYLDHKGLHWREFRAKENLNYIKEKWIDFFSLVISVFALIISILALLSSTSG